MKQAEITGASQPLAVVDKPTPSAPSNGLVIKTLFSGICHTDLHLIEDQVPLGKGKFWRHRDVLGDKFIGVIPGHEIIGDIVQLGSDVPQDSGLTVGDRILVYPWRGCRDCWYCQSGVSNMCMTNASTTTDIGKGCSAGGYASHIAVPEWQLAVKSPSNIAPEMACMLPCSALTTYNAIEKTKESIARSLEGHNTAQVLIVGAGGLGVWCTLLLKMIYKNKPVKVFCADISEDRLEASKKVGADGGIVWAVDASEDDIVALTAEKLGKMDAVFDFVGLPKTFRCAFYSLNNGGTVVPLGFAGGECSIPIPHIIGRSIAIRGNRVGSIEQLREVTALVSENGLGSGAPPIEIFNINDVNKALDKLKAREILGRAVLTFD